MLSFQCVVFSVQVTTTLHTSHYTLHASHFTLIPDAADRAGVHRPLDPPVLRLIAPVPLPWDQSGILRSKPQAFHLQPYTSGLWSGACGLPRGM